MTNQETPKDILGHPQGLFYLFFARDVGTL